jgi:hypothetical protein
VIVVVQEFPPPPKRIVFTRDVPEGMNTEYVAFTAKNFLNL